MNARQRFESAVKDFLKATSFAGTSYRVVWGDEVVTTSSDGFVSCKEEQHSLDLFVGDVGILGAVVRIDQQLYHFYDAKQAVDFALQNLPAHIKENYE